MQGKTSQRCAIGILVLTGFAGAANGASAQREEPSFTVHVRNRAGVNSETLQEAENAATEIFRKAGVAVRWVSTVPTGSTSQEETGENGVHGPAHIRLDILSKDMAEPLGLPDTVNGLAPGTGPDRLMVYIFYERVHGLAQREARRQEASMFMGYFVFRASEAQILGEVMAHEIGHITLNLDEHTETGIMRGAWDLRDLSDIAKGYLVFTKEQSRTIQADALRREQEQKQKDSKSSAAHFMMQGDKSR